METPREGTPLVDSNLQNQPIYESVMKDETITLDQSKGNKGLRNSDKYSKFQDGKEDRIKWWLKLNRMSRRQSSEGAFIHITGTGTTLEESFEKKRFCRGLTKSDNSNADPDDFPPGVGQYDDFHTIDWQRDLARDRYRHRYIVRKMSENFCYYLKGYYDALSGWICVFLVGVLAGCIAAFIDIGEGWMKDLKEGVCPNAFYLNKEQCCWSSNHSYYEGDKCNQWYEWPEFITVNLTEVESYAISYAAYVLWSLFFGTLASCMVRSLAPYACGSGVPEIKTILSGFIIRGYLGKMTLLVKSVAIMLAVSSGLSLGKEGPLVHVVCCIGNVMSYLFPKYGKNEAKKREILSAASAAGVSVAFNAPIGGVLFSLEEVSYYFPLKTLWRSFFCALVAAFVLRSINPFGTDHPVKYYMNATRGWIFIELVPFILIGVFGGIVGAIFIRCNIAWCRFRKMSKLGRYPITEVLIVTLITALVNYPNEFTKINASDLIKLLFSQCGMNDVSLMCDYRRNLTSIENHMEILGPGPGIQIALYLLGLALITIWISTVFTFGMKVPSGLFVPSMAIGAIIGRIVGLGTQRLVITFKNFWMFSLACTPNEDCLSPELYAMIGAAASLAGVTRMTVSLVVIMFELTGSVDYIVPLMTTVVTSKWVADALEKGGIYEAHIRLNKYPFLNNKEEIETTSMAIDLTRDKRRTKEPLHCIYRVGMTLESVENILKKTTHNGFPVVVSQENFCLVGIVSRRDLNLGIEHLKSTKDGICKTSEIYFTKERPGLNTIPAPLFLPKILDMAPITVTVQTPMETVIDMFCKLGLRHVLITDNGKLVDIITKKDILRHIHEVTKI